MIRWEDFCRAAAASRLEQAPSLDVTGGVWKAIRARRRQDLARREPVLIAAAVGLSLAAAAIAVFVALPAWQEASEFAHLLPNPLTLVLQ